MGQWTSPAFKFEVPASAPAWTFDISIFGEMADGTELFEIQTTFSL